MQIDEIPVGRAKNIIGKRYGRLTILYRTNVPDTVKPVAKPKSYWKCLCDCGNTTVVSTSGLSTGTQSCGCLSREKASKRFGIDITGQKFGSLTVIERDLTQSRNHQWWLCKCDCGNPQLESVNGVRLRNGSKTQCSLCMPRSRGEEQIKKILLENNIPFIQEKTFEDCRFPESNRKARFDFYVNNSYIIEFDGRQHIEPTSGDCSNWWSLDYVQSHDAIKNQYCADNNIPLIRIPYSKINYIKLQDLLPETSKYIKTVETQ